MRLKPNTNLGPYEILAPIGAGGMGEVYRATDTRLGRQVAIKVSSREFNDRFEREAKAISALNHPNICTLYDIGPNYLVMEFVEGEMLSKMIERGPLPLDKALAYAVQILDALAAAHAKGIIHRDLKPGNIIITRNGAKVLDFGLAKLSSERLPSTSADEMVTVTEPITRAGAILGTLYYLSPEQVEGKEADERNDIFSFGLVLYEMITGQRPFTGDTQAAVLAALMKDQPSPMYQRQPACPRALERLVRKCLEKKPEDRWHSARDLKPALELIDLDAPSMSSARASASAPIATEATKPAHAKWLWPAIAATALLAMAGVAAWALWFKAAPPARASRFQVTLPEGVEFSEYLSVSPDGHKLAFNATGDQSGLWIRDLDTLEWRKLQGTDSAVSPFWSPDSKYLAFGVGGALKKVDVMGGTVQTLCTIPQLAGTGTWSEDGVIVFGPYRSVGPIRRIAASGGIPVDLTEIDRASGETANNIPVFLPDGKHFLYLWNGTPEVRGIYVASIDAKPAEQPRTRILESVFAASYVGGNLFFMRENTLMVQPFDAGKLQLRGEPVPVAEHVGGSGAVAFFSVSRTGVLAYRTGPAINGGGGTLPTWFDRQGKVTSIVGQPFFDQPLVLSPDATRAAGRDAANQARGDIWLLDFARGVRTRLTFRQSPGTLPVWSPDGSRIAFSAGNTAETIYEIAVSGAGEEKELMKASDGPNTPTSWSRDGRFLLYTGRAPKTGADIWVLPMAGDRKPSLLLGTQFIEGQARFSPDGRWISYTSDESGRNEVYIRPFVASGPSGGGPSLGAGKWQLSRDGGTQARWRDDGKEIVFLGPSRSMMAVDVNGSGAALQVGAPHLLFTAQPSNSLDVAADGKRFLLTMEPGQVQPKTAAPITVVLNWQADLKK